MGRYLTSGWAGVLAAVTALSASLASAQGLKDVQGHIDIPEIGRSETQPNPVDVPIFVEDEGMAPSVPVVIVGGPDVIDRTTLRGDTLTRAFEPDFFAPTSPVDAVGRGAEVPAPGAALVLTGLAAAGLGRRRRS
ncbi:MAG: hypothetical protein SFZ24_05410 [Planctomycetota bacterium]|nr:hypothetical protein [Planctomycetota bacterium]